MADLIRGTTPSYIVDFTDSGVDVADITKATLTAKYRCVKTDLSDGLVLDPVENVIRYHFTQAETLAYHAGEKVYLEMDVVSDGGQTSGRRSKSLSRPTPIRGILRSHHLRKLRCLRPKRNSCRTILLSILLLLRDYSQHQTGNSHHHRAR